jgi:hypothetical protein
MEHRHLTALPRRPAQPDRGTVVQNKISCVISFRMPTFGVAQTECLHLDFRGRPLSRECWKYWTPYSTGNFQIYGTPASGAALSRELDPTLPKITTRERGRLHPNMNEIQMPFNVLVYGEAIPGRASILDNQS